MSVLKVKLLSPIAKVPTKAHATDACYDIYTCGVSTIPSFSRCVVKTGVSIELPEGCVADIRPRSGISVNGIDGQEFFTGKTRRFNASVILGTIDEGYRGEVGIIIHNNDTRFTLPSGTRIAQMLIHRVEPTQMVVTDYINESDRGTDGFGSTGEQ